MLKKDLRGKKKLQHYYSSFLSKHAVNQNEDKVREHGTPHDKARTFSNNGSFAGAWLHSAPTKNERQMDDITFRTALKIRLGVEFGGRPVVCKCKKRSSVDEHADHLFNCHLFTAEVKDRHDAIVHEVLSCLNMLPNPFHFRNMVICELPLEMMGELLMVSLGD